MKRKFQNTLQIIAIYLIISVLADITPAKSQKQNIFWRTLQTTLTDGTTADSSWVYLEQTPPGLIPESFPPDYLLANSTWWWHGPPVFSPDGKEFFMSRYYAGSTSGAVIYSMKVIDQEWTTPIIPEFCENYSCNSPCFTSNGDTLFFTSRRPETSIYYVTKIENTWSDPTEVNISIPAQATFGNSVSVARNGTLYFELSISDDANDICKSEYNGGQYSEAINLGISINSNDIEFGPYIAPNEQYIIFSSTSSDGFGASDLYISTKDMNGDWTARQNLGNSINSNSDDSAPIVSSDGKYFFFCTEKPEDEGYNPYWVDIHILDPFIGMGIEHEKSESIFHNFPNPFHQSTTIEYYLQNNSNVLIKIFDISGKEVKSLVYDIQNQGKQSVVWNGTNNYGNKVPSGIYYCRIQENNQIQIKKMVFIMK